MFDKIKMQVNSYSPVPLNQSAIKEVANQIKTEYGRKIQKELRYYLRIAEHINEAFQQDEVIDKVDIVRKASLEATIAIPIDSQFKLICVMDIERNHITIESVQITDSLGFEYPLMFFAFSGSIHSRLDNQEMISFYHSCFVSVDNPLDLSAILESNFPKLVQENIFYKSALFQTEKIKYVEPTISEFKKLISNII
jgi:hypothetical protein